MGLHSYGLRPRRSSAKKKVTLWLVFSRGKKQYFTHSMHLLVKYCFYHSNIKIIHTFAPPCNILYISSKPWGGGGSTWVKFCWVRAAGLSEPLPHYSVFCSQFIIDPMLVTFVEIYPKSLLARINTYP